MSRQFGKRWKCSTCGSVRWLNADDQPEYPCNCQELWKRRSRTCEESRKSDEVCIQQSYYEGHAVECDYVGCPLLEDWLFEERRSLGDA